MSRRLFFGLALLLSMNAAHATIYYVDGSKVNNSGTGLSWSAAKKDIQVAINMATVSGDEVWVKAGTYLPTLDPNGGTSQRDKTFYLTTQDIKLYGGFAGTETSATQRNPLTNLTVLSGDLDGAGGTNDAYHIVVSLGRSRACEIDGFTLTGGRADAPGAAFTISATNTTVYRTWGGGIYNIGSSPVINNCTISGNYAYNQGGGIANAVKSNPAIQNCIISNNRADVFNGGGIYNTNSGVNVSNSVLSGNTAAQGGGGMYSLGTNNDNSFSSVSNCVVVNNGAVRGGGIYITDYSVLNISNSTFSANTATGTGDGGGLQYGAGNFQNSAGSVINCIFYGNTGSVVNQQNISKAAGAGVVNVSYSLIGDYNAAATNNYTSGAGIFAGDPLFVDAANPKGADAIFGTSDDGLVLPSCSPALNSGSGTTPATDILGNSRVGIMDLGAYEYQSSATIPVLASATTTDTRNLTSGSIVMLGNCANIIASLYPKGASRVSGNVTGKVYVQTTAPLAGTQPYVRRYYDISPAVNPNTATGEITLYFTQADFDDYNNVRGSLSPLPLDGADAAGHKANIRITQQHGTSATGLPGSYTGWTGVGAANVLIIPGSIVWNAAATRWEVTFPVTGFSGFFLTSNIGVPLPVQLLRFTARRKSASENQLAWSTGNEDPGTEFLVERSGDGGVFEKIGRVGGTGKAGSYTFEDNAPLRGDNYYRLHIQKGGSTGYSIVARVRSGENHFADLVTVSPVPAADQITVVCGNASWHGQTVRIADMTGRVVAQIMLSEKVTLDIGQWSPGVYVLCLPDGSTRRLVKQ